MASRKCPKTSPRIQIIQFGNAAAPEWRFVKAGRALHLSVRPRFSTNSADAAIQYAKTGGGLTRVLAYQAASALKRGRLKIVLQEFEQPVLPIHIVYPTSRLLSAKVRAFIDLVIESADWRFG
jgi:DNA-binding transcriptional LysR family regulator